MVCKNKLPPIRTILLGVNLLCCSVVIYKVFSEFETTGPGTRMSGREPAAMSLREDCKHVCTTAECVEIANDIMLTMNPNVNPCEDFNVYACGNYEQRMGNDRNSSILGDRIFDLYVILRDIIETSTETEDNEDAISKMKTVFDTCMDTKNIELHAFRDMLSFISDIGIPDWPNLNENFTFSGSSFLDIISNITSYGQAIFMTVYQTTREGNASFVVEKPPILYKTDTELMELENTIKMILDYAGINSTNMNSIWKDFMQVEDGIQQLLKISKEHNASSQIECLEDSDSNYYVQCLGKDAETDSILCKISTFIVQQDIINYEILALYISCDNSYYFENLHAVLQSFSDRALGHYMALQLFLQNIRNINIRIRHNSNYVFKDRREDRPIPKRESLDNWKFCVWWMIKNQGMPLAYLYTNQNLPTEAVDKLSNMVKEYSERGSKLVELQDWIQNETRIISVKDVREITTSFASDVEWMRNRTRVEEFYKEFQPSASSFIWNVMNCKKYHFYLNRSNQYFYPGFFSQYLEVGATSGMSTIDLTFGIILPPLFNPGYPKLFNLAKIGLYIGHETGHNFVSRYEMRMLRYKGNEENNDTETFENFNEKTKCFKDQYSRFQYDKTGLMLNGSRTLFENLPDSFGQTVTEKISEELILQMNKDLFALPGIHYPLEEISVISSAQGWCGVMSIEMEKHSQKKATHSPSKFRLLGTLQNSNRFSQIFNCPSGSPMNPRKKCSLIE